MYRCLHCVYVYMYICTYIYIHIHMHIYIHKHRCGDYPRSRFQNKDGTLSYIEDPFGALARVEGWGLRIAGDSCRWLDQFARVGGFRVVGFIVVRNTSFVMSCLILDSDPEARRLDKQSWRQAAFFMMEHGSSAFRWTVEYLQVRGCWTSQYKYFTLRTRL